MCETIRSKRLFTVAMVAFLLSAVLQLWSRHYPSVHPDMVDGMRGLLLGIYFGGIAMVVWRRGRPSSRAR